MSLTQESSSIHPVRVLLVSGQVKWGVLPSSLDFARIQSPDLRFYEPHRLRQGQGIGKRLGRKLDSPPVLQAVDSADVSSETFPPGCFSFRIGTVSMSSAAASGRVPISQKTRL